jgi:hypothetical protein
MKDALRIGPPECGATWLRNRADVVPKSAGDTLG